MRSRVELYFRARQICRMRGTSVPSAYPKSGERESAMQPPRECRAETWEGWRFVQNRSIHTAIDRRSAWVIGVPRVCRFRQPGIHHFCSAGYNAAVLRVRSIWQEVVFPRPYLGDAPARAGTSQRRDSHMVVQHACCCLQLARDDRHKREIRKRRSALLCHRTGRSGRW